MAAPSVAALLDQYEFTSLSYAACATPPAPPEWFALMAERLIGAGWHFVSCTTEYLAEEPQQTIVTRIFVRARRGIRRG